MQRFPAESDMDQATFCIYGTSKHLCSIHHNVISRHISHIQAGLFFYSTPHRGRVYKWKFCPFICLSVCHHFLFFSFIQTLSSGESRNLSHGIQCPPSMSPMPPTPKSTGPPSQSTDPQMNRIISQTFLAQFDSLFQR